MGNVVNPILPIKEGDGDSAHIDPEAVPQIRFSQASKNHQFLVDKILQQDQGITYGLYQQDEEVPEGEAEPEDEEELEEGEEPKPKPPPTEKLPKHLYIEEVVREQRIYYFTVPRLGSYLAIKMEYNSCLFEEAFDAAVIDFQDIA